MKNSDRLPQPVKRFGSWISPKNNVYVVPLIIVVVMFGIGEIIRSGFAASNNIGSILTLSCILAIVTYAQSTVVLSGNGGLDLTVGPVITMAALIGSSVCMSSASNIPLGIAAVLLIGAVVGVINSSGILFAGIPPLIMTLFMASVVDGFTLAYTQGQTVPSMPKVMLMIGRQIFEGAVLRWLLILTIVLTVVIELIIRKSKTGKSLYLVGSNRRAARLSGLNVNKEVMFAYIFSGMLSAIAGFLLVSYSGSGMLHMGDSYTMTSIAATVIGGTKMTGGEGKISGGFLGAVIFTLLNNLLVALGMAAGVRTMVEGLILLLILLIYTRGDKLRQ